MDSKSRTLAFELEYNETTVMACDHINECVLISTTSFGRGYVPAANKFNSGWTAKAQNRSCSLLNVCTAVRFARSQTLMVLSSPHETMSSCLGWNNALD